MNRIILIGNGFDLAHGLKTSYRDFIEDFWGSLIGRQGELKPIDNSLVKLEPNGIWGSNYDSTCTDNFSIVKFIAKETECVFKIKNRFLEHISSINYDLQWVDVENEYYSLLKEDYKITNKEEPGIGKLNEDFEKVKKLLEEYLIRTEKDFNNRKPQVKNEVGEMIFSSFAPKDMDSFGLDYWVDKKHKEWDGYQKHGSPEPLKDSDQNLFDWISDKVIYWGDDNMRSVNLEKRVVRDRLLSKYGWEESFKENPNQYLYLNFNYTNTHELYLKTPPTMGFSKKPSIKCINIHGKLKKENHKMIFGFGDELDEEYKDIENLNQNEYLENIKSIRYSDNSSYKELLEFLSSDKYQIFIFGHSCGNSDRTLLNTLFEHENCCSVKPFYRGRKDGTDNYSDIVRNISRNFTDKAEMRDKLVNKTYTEALFK